MRRVSLNRTATICLALGALAGTCVSIPASAQSQSAAVSTQSDTTQLLGKAHALEVRGRIDLARQTWQQVLLIDPNNTEALAGMARAAKLQGKTQESNQYLGKLRAVNPNDPNIARIEQMGTAQDTSVQLQDAGRLSQSGQYARAMAILRQVYGDNPPPGDPALSYYLTEAATEDGRPAAIAGLRALVDRYPQDSRYQVALGKILTYNPRTREEGRRLLQRHPDDPEAVQALRQSLIWDAQNPSSVRDIQAYLAHHRDDQLSAALAEAKATARRNGTRLGAPPPPPPTPEQLEAQASLRQQNAASRAAYDALNAKNYPEAESRFQAMLAKNPNDPQALAGLGYVRMGQSNFGGAISYLEQAEQDGARTAGVDKALRDSRFFYTMQVATSALNENDLATAQTQFTKAAALRPSDPSPLLGLGGTLMKAQQPAQAVSVFSEYVRMAPRDRAAWRGLFMAQYGAGQYQAALDTDARIPASVKRELIHDPQYLRTLASVYQALGRDADAQRILRSALDLPFPPDARGVRADMMLQYASLLAAANHPDQAAGLYRQVLEGDSTNIPAYQGLINTDHVLGQDTAAYQVLQSMPPSTYETAMQSQGFQTTVAAVYQATGHNDLAQQTLQTYIQNEQANNQPAPLAAEVELAGLYLQHGDTEHAFPIYRAVVLADPGRVDAWNGLINALHSTGHNQEALAEIQQIPPNVRLKLESDPAYLQTVGSIYAGLNQPQAAMSFYRRVQQRYLSQHIQPPADIDIQEAWLLFNSKNDPILLRQLLMLGGRGDLTDEQRLTVQTIWANWAVRRANQNIDEGNYKRAIAILNAAARAFPGNPDVLKALASGYAAVGLPRQAVEIFKAQDLSTATLDDYRASVGAALSANDLKDAEVWLRFGLDQYPRDGQLLVLAAKFETARGDAGRAADYYKASLTVFPQDDPGSQLTNEMLHPLVHRIQHVQQSQDLATLLTEADPNINRNGGGNNGLGLAEQQQRPYLPSYTGSPVIAPVQVEPTLPNGQYAPQHSLPGTGYTGNTMPTQNDYPQSSLQQRQLQQQRGATLGNYNPDAAEQEQQRDSTLQGYPPQSKLIEPFDKDQAQLASNKSIKPILHLHPNPEMEAKYGPYVSYMPSEGLPHRVAAVEQGIVNTAYLPNAGSNAGTGITAHLITASFHPQSGYPTAQPTQTYTPMEQYVPPADGYKPPPAIHLAPRYRRQPAAVRKQQPVANTYRSEPLSQNSVSEKSFATPTPGFERGPIHQHPQSYYAQPGYGTPTGNTADGTPIVSYIPASRPAERHAYSRRSTAAMRARAAEIRRNQAQAPVSMIGQSHPPVEDYTTDVDPNAQLQNTQYTSQPNDSSQIAQPQQQTTIQQQPTTYYQNTTPTQTQQDTQTQTYPTQTYQNYGQQYPQPNTHSTEHLQERAPVRRRRTTRRTVRPTQLPAQAPVQQQSPVTYPGYTQPLTNTGYPQIPAPYPLATPPSDYDLQQRDVPPLRGYYDPRADQTDNAPLTDRQQAELNLATLEGSYSSWIGASVIGSYRSGTPGVDRMAGVEVPFEASAALGKSWRFTVLPTAIFLNSGVLNPQDNLGSFPVFGTVLGSSTQIFPQQYSVGIGGEAQLTSKTFSIAGGYSAQGFLVRNGIGRFKWKPGNGHFTLFGGRDPVKETQLSYAGLRDPGQPNAFTLGPIWGGVVQTGGGVRIDTGNAKAGFYLQGEGYSLTGYHVLQNHKYDASMGAYFRAYVWPQYGTLNIGGTIFGEHYDYNERIESYGWGGYFSPNVYFLFAVPVTFNGHYKENIHYVINGSVGVQTFQEDTEPYYPLDPNLQLNLEAVSAANCTTIAVGAAQPCGYIPYNSNTGLNYGIDVRVAYSVTDHWFLGGFLSGNNTNDYNSVSGGFFLRYLFRSQTQTVTYPTGLFPDTGFRPLRVP